VAIAAISAAPQLTQASKIAYGRPNIEGRF